MWGTRRAFRSQLHSQSDIDSTESLYDMHHNCKPNRAQQRRQARANRRSNHANDSNPWQVIEAPPNLVNEADLAFFRHFPARTVRMRPVSRVEVERQVTNYPDLPAVPPGWRWFVLVNSDGRDVRHRQFLVAPAETDCDLSEAEARAKWDEVPPPADLAAVAALKCLAEIGGGCIAIRLSVGPGPKAYSDPEAAHQAITAYVANGALSRPAIFGSTAGVFALWPFPNLVLGTGPFWVAIVEESLRLAGLRVTDVTVGDARAALAAVQGAGK